MRERGLETEGNFFCALGLWRERDGLLMGKTLRIPTPLNPEGLAGCWQRWKP